MNIEDLLSRKINLPEIKHIASWVKESNDNRELLWKSAHSDDRRTSVNALWALTHVVASESAWLTSLRDEIIGMLLVESDTGKKRMMLQLLREQEYTPDDIRADLLDYCLSKINSESEPYAVRCFSIYTAFKMCCHFPELIDELEAHLEMMQFQTLSPGLKSALHQTQVKIARLRKNR